MFGLIYYILCFMVGLVLVSLIIPGIYSFTEKTYSGKKLNFSSAFVLVPAAMVVGTLVMGWTTYGLALLFADTGKALTFANAIVMTIAVFFVALGLILIKKEGKISFSGLKKGFTFKDTFVLLFLTTLTVFIMFLTFYVKDGELAVGISVFSDFAPHLGMIRSFSTGNNFPTSYSHFGGEDIKYHFMFQFLVGNLEYLGLRIDWAFNLPSIVSLVCAGMLLYTLAVKLFGKRSVGILALIFFLFRSGGAFITYISEIDGSWSDILANLRENTTYIGKTAHEDWGLWNLNVYVNQRHLAFGISILLLVINLMLEPVFEAMKRISRGVEKQVEKKGDTFNVRFSAFLQELVFRKEGWLVKDLRVCIFCGLLLGLGAFFNGACIIACLLVLLFLAFLTDRRLEYLIVAVIAVVLSSVQSAIFVDGSIMEFRWEPGFLAEVKTFFGTLDYLKELLGILPVVLVAAFLMVNSYYKWILVAFMSPIIFAATFQMTPDVAVNHKYIMIGCMMVNLFVAAFIYKLYHKRGVANRVVAIMLIILLTCTGVYDLNVLIKKNSPYYGGSMLYSLDDPVTEWIMTNTDSEDIFLTDWYSLNNVVLGGAMLYYGWPYYAWSAGYDTDFREEQVKLMYEACSSEELERLVKENDISYIIVDQAARENENYVVREDVISATYPCVYTQGEDYRKFSIYATGL